MRNDIVLCGVGGQGTILASRLLAAAAMDRGLPVKTAETIGMAQRGGSVFSHVRIGDERTSPLIASGCADLLIAFEPAEAVRQLGYVREGATVVVSDKPIVPVSATVGGPSYELDEIMGYLHRNVDSLVVVDAEAAARDLGSQKCLNVVLLGAAVRAGTLDLTIADIEGAVRRLVPDRFLEMNLAALTYARTSNAEF